MSRMTAGFSALPEATERLATFAEPFIAIRMGGASVRKPGILLALQEIINDLYDGFLSQEDRRKLEKEGAIPVLRRIPRPPRVKLDAGPRALPHYNQRQRTVHLPVWLAQPDGVLAWVSLAHETSGHAILDAYDLEGKLRKEVGAELRKLKSAKSWMRWFDEAVSDCLGVLNLGPAMALGSIASWRAYGQLTRPDIKPQLPCVALESETTHPPPALRAYLMAHVTSKLAYKGAKAISSKLKETVRREVEICRFGKQLLEAAEIFADVIVERPQRALNGFRFLDLQDWRDTDESTAEQLRQVLLEDSFPSAFASTQYAAHAVAGAVMEHVNTNGSGGDRHRALHNLIRLLKLMHESARGQSARKQLRL